MLCQFVTFQFHQMSVADRALQGTVLERFIQPVLKSPYKYLLAGIIKQTAIQLSIKMSVLYLFSVHDLEYHSVNYNRLKNLRNVQRNEYLRSTGLWK